MRKFKGSEAPTSAFTGREKARLALMAVVALVITGMLLYTGRTRQEPPPLVDVEAAPEAHVELPEIPVDALRGAVDDRSDTARVRMERPAVAMLLDVVRRLTPAHYEALDAITLDAQRAEEVLADPDAWRGRALTARGRLAAHAERRPADGSAPEHHVTIALEGGGHAHALALSAPEDVAVGDWVKLSGLFLKVYADEVPGEDWVAAPLIVGARLEPSVAPLEPRPELREGDLELVVDDTLQRVLGLDGPGRYELLAHARDAAPSTYDFAAATEIDREVLSDLMRDPTSHRGQPFRLPISRVVVVRHRVLDENPARLDQVTELWIANTSWDRELPVIGVHLPGRVEGLATNDLLTGELLFYKNHAFDSGNSTRRLAPFFVGLSVERFEPQESPALRQILWAVLALTVVLSALLITLVRRDRKRAEKFEREQVARRQKRRAATAARAT